MAMEERIPPQSLDAEQSLLGAMMISKDAIAAVITKIQPEYFYKDSHMHIFTAMASLYKKNEPIDIVTTSAELQKLDLLESAGGKAHLADILNSVPTAANVDHYSTIVQEKGLLRRLIDSGTEIVTDAFEDNRGVESILDDAQKKILDISMQTNETKLEQLGGIVGTVWDTISDRSSEDNAGVIGVPTGYADLDEFTSGFQPSDLLILAARPAMGKTGLALNFAMNAALVHQKSVAIFSLEMPKEQLALRMLSALAKIDMKRLRQADLKDHEYESMSQALGRYSEAPIFVDDTPSISPLSLKAKCRRLMLTQPIDLIIIDYLQLMRIGHRRVESRFQEVSEIVRSVKAIAKELNVPIIALSQLSRDVEKRGGDIPKLSDLRESGEIEQTADLVMFLHREDYYEQTNLKVSPTKLVIAKHRNGPTGHIDLIFRKDVSRFEMSSKGFESPPVPE